MGFKSSERLCHCSDSPPKKIGGKTNNFWNTGWNLVGGTPKMVVVV